MGQDALDAELPAADCVALSLPGTDETAHLFDAARIARMKPGAILLNVGRGSAVDTDALAEALRSRRLFAAGLDVTDTRSRVPPDHPLWREPHAIITPHISGRFSCRARSTRLSRSLQSTCGITRPANRWTTRFPARGSMCRATPPAAGCAATPTCALPGAETPRPTTQ